MPQFVQLTKEDCQYLLNLIAEMDSATLYTERQRSYTVPKLHKIMAEPRSARLAYQDVDYLLELIEDDDLEELEMNKAMAESSLREIQALQNARFEESKGIEDQRATRKARRLGLAVMESASIHTTA